MTQNSLEQLEIVPVTAKDADLLDGLGNVLSDQVTETSMRGGNHTELDDERSQKAWELAGKIGNVCFYGDGTPKEGQVAMELDSGELGLLQEARMEGRVPHQREAS